MVSLWEAMGYVSLGLVVYPMTPLLTLNMLNKKSPRIRDFTHLEEVVNEEAPKLGLNPREIEAHFECHPEHYWTSCASKSQDGTMRIWMNPDDATERIVRHELYHLYRDFRGDKKMGFFKYFFVSEIRADAYAVLGWKL